MILRDYQEQTLEKVQRSSKRAVLVVAPTGAGKGTMATELLARYARTRRRAIFIVHRREIIHDIERRLKRAQVRTAQTLRSDAFVRVVSVQTALNSELAKGVELLVLDEAHHYASDEWGKIVDLLKPQKVVGFTATPQRPDGRSLGDMFDTLFDAVSYSELLRRGLIVPCRVLRPRGQLVNELAQDPVDAYLRYAPEERSLIFVRRVDEAEDVAARLNGYGVRAGVVTARTDKDVRDETMAQLERGELRAVVNVGVLTEGVDVPHVSCIVLARPTGHASTYVQIVGRALRAAPGKTEATLIDLVGASHKHGLPAADRDYSLHGDAIKLHRDRESDDRERSGERKEVNVLDLELEEVRSGLPAGYGPATKRSGGKPIKLRAESRLCKPSDSKYAPRTTICAPMPVSPGFVYEDRGFYMLRWREHGVTCRFGLATKDKETAEQMLQLFRTDGAEAVREAVRLYKRRGASSWLDGEKGQYKVIFWNDERTQRIKVTTHAPDKAAADRLAEMFKLGRHAEAYKLIDAYREAGFRAAPPDNTRRRNRTPRPKLEIEVVPARDSRERNRRRREELAQSAAAE